MRSAAPTSTSRTIMGPPTAATFEELTGNGGRVEPNRSTVHLPERLNGLVTCPSTPMPRGSRAQPLPSRRLCSEVEGPGEAVAHLGVGFLQQPHARLGLLQSPFSASRSRSSTASRSARVPTALPSFAFVRNARAAADTVLPLALVARRRAIGENPLLSGPPNRRGTRPSVMATIGAGSCTVNQRADVRIENFAVVDRPIPRDATVRPVEALFTGFDVSY